MQQICAAPATDIVDERDTLPPVVFRSSVLSLQDCKKDMKLLGVVRNIVAFGANPPTLTSSNYLLQMKVYCVAFLGL